MNASSEQDRLVVNGMSYSGRDGHNANSAIIVSVSPEDYGSEHPLAGIEFQRRLEEKAYCIGRGLVPVERYEDYKNAVLAQGNVKKEGTAIENTDLQWSRTDVDEGNVGFRNLEPCIKGKWCFAPVHEILPEHLNKAFVEGLEQFGRIIPGFDDGNVLIEGVESRTSSPLRIIRDKTLQSSLRGLYPCGEGAGYAGGITSAAMDGIQVAEEVALHILNEDKN